MQKCSFSFLSFAKSENKRVEKVLLGDGGVEISGSGKEVGKGGEWVNTVQIFCTHECKWKKDNC
jgi:hypothetical protein